MKSWAWAAPVGVLHLASPSPPNPPFTDDGEPVAHLAAVRERLWTRAALAPHLDRAGFKVVDGIPAVPRDDAAGRVDAEILVLAAVE
ncbi:hypothetical protein IAG44_39430 [Streptomyces roseirectus]|uniref:Methyltransferase n=1 Tax=Streptomyces roseirectus TaxID=2768066 RepID=A0A7H0IQ39_9ACTN|nr:hypothetical protein [Streptomyces roseirectus]QNP74905.1 hypothetical protein IAG44_39430 [Streptomyces roseirectus]